MYNLKNFTMKLYNIFAESTNSDATTEQINFKVIFDFEPSYKHITNMVKNRIKSNNSVGLHIEIDLEESF